VHGTSQRRTVNFISEVHRPHLVWHISHIRAGVRLVMARVLMLKEFNTLVSHGILHQQGFMRECGILGRQ
jgi:hypothetical protein